MREFCVFAGLVACAIFISMNIMIRVVSPKRYHKLVCVRKDDIQIGICFYQAKEQTQEIEKRLLEKGYANLTEFKCILS